MKRIVTGLTALFLTLGAFAQGGIPILDRVPGHRVLFHYTYSLSQGGKPMTQVTDGDVDVEDNAYLLSGLGLRCAATAPPAGAWTARRRKSSSKPWRKRTFSPIRPSSSIPTRATWTGSA